MMLQHAHSAAGCRACIATTLLAPIANHQLEAPSDIDRALLTASHHNHDYRARQNQLKAGEGGRRGGDPRRAPGREGAGRLDG